jgi:hypothetical protein
MSIVVGGTGCWGGGVHSRAVSGAY